MKKLILVASLFMSGSVIAATPNINHQSASGSDRVRTQDGASCDQAVATGKTFTVGLYGSQGNNDYNYHDPMRGYGNTGDDVGIYAGVSIQFGGAKRIDCKRMYDNEMARKTAQLSVYKKKTELELEQLRMETIRLKQLLNNKTHFVE